MFRSLALFSLLSLLPAAVLGRGCVAFDNSNNLYAFGGSRDVALGSASSWGSPNPKTLPSKGRPPWTGASTQCFTSAFHNSLYVVQGDAKNPGDVHIFDFAKKVWRKQKTAGVPALNDASSVLDHDTNVLYTFAPSGLMYFLDLSSAPSSKTLKWTVVGKAPFPTKGYRPVLGEASQHILFLGHEQGKADLFVVHFAGYEKKPVPFPSNGHVLPKTHGQAAGIPYVSTNVAGDQVFFVPDDFSSSYVLSHWTNPGKAGSSSGAPSQLLAHINTTQVFAAPPFHDVKAAYAASPSSVVQLDSKGRIAYARDVIDHFAVDKKGGWKKMAYTLPGM